MIEDRFRRHAVVVQALLRYNIDINALPWEECENVSGEEVARHSTGDLPSIHLHSDGTARLRWWNNGKSVRYEIEEDGYTIVTLEGLKMPDTLLTALTGKPLNQVVEMPGASSMRIIEAVNSKAFVSDPFDVRIGVEPAREAALIRTSND